ncbi:MAG: hydrolase TatD [Bryobacterales bacterium]|nr:hydrolase TatD [Bryobacterales bacterium]
MIDLHCHLDLYHDPNAIALECARRDMYVLSVTNTPSAWLGTSALAPTHSRIKTGLGLHPQLAKQRKVELALFETLLPKTRYVGEVGLDGSPGFADIWQDQLEVFERILSLCRQSNGKIMSIHSRRAATPVLDYLERSRGSGIPVLHWFSGSQRELARAIDLGCWFSVGPAMLLSVKGRSLFERMPRKRILTESDGPFAMTDGRSLLPWEAHQAISQIAKAWELSPERAESQLLDNLRILTAPPKHGHQKSESLAF